jgi:hypothetical protein
MTARLQSLGILMQGSDISFALWTLVVELKELKCDHDQAYLFTQLSLLLPTVDSTIPRVVLAPDIFWHFRICISRWSDRC